MKNRKVFYAVLNMGLGHAARSLPVIREFLARGWEVLLGSNGRALEFLKTELPRSPFVVTPDYAIKYSKSGWLLPGLLLQTPRLLAKVREEQRFCRSLVADFSPDIIFSDHCYGMYHPRTPSYFISHQIYFGMPRWLNFFSPVISRLNFRYHKKYSKIIIPDLPSGEQGLLSGRLSQMPPGSNGYCYAGMLSSIGKEEIEPSVDLLVSISGPEPQRTLFEQKILAQIDIVPGKKIVVLGKSEKMELVRKTADLKVYTHIPRREMEKFFNRANLIVSRPGYSTLMELAELGKKALLVPTPGQTEQIYLAKRMQEKKWFYSVPQKELELANDIETAVKFDGLFKPGITRRTVCNIFDNLLEI